MRKCWSGAFHLISLPKVGSELHGLYWSSECGICCSNGDWTWNVIVSKKDGVVFPNIYAHRWETAHIWEPECPSSFHGTIHACRLKHGGKFQSTCQPKHQALSSEDHKAKLHLFPGACFFTEHSTTLITSVAHWQYQTGAIISSENMKVKENIHPKLFGIKALNKICNQYIAMLSFSFIFFLNTQCLMQCCEHSLDPFSVMSTSFCGSLVIMSPSRFRNWVQMTENFINSVSNIKRFLLLFFSNCW